MIEGALGIIDKMRIEVYPNKDFNDVEAIKTIFVQVNPESYTTNLEVELEVIKHEKNKIKKK